MEMCFEHFERNSCMLANPRSSRLASLSIHLRHHTHLTLAVLHGDFSAAVVAVVQLGQLDPEAVLLSCELFILILWPQEKSGKDRTIYGGFPTNTNWFSFTGFPSIYIPLALRWKFHRKHIFSFVFLSGGISIKRNFSYLKRSSSAGGAMENSITWKA